MCQTQTSLKHKIISLRTPPRPSEISMNNWRAKVKPVLTSNLWYLRGPPVKKYIYMKCLNENLSLQSHFMARIRGQLPHRNYDFRPLQVCVFSRRKMMEWLTTLSVIQISFAGEMENVTHSWIMRNIVLMEETAVATK